MKEDSMTAVTKPRPLTVVLCGHGASAFAKGCIDGCEARGPAISSSSLVRGLLGLGFQLLRIVREIHQACDNLVQSFLDSLCYFSSRGNSSSSLGSCSSMSSSDITWATPSTPMVSVRFLAQSTFLCARLRVLVASCILAKKGCFGSLELGRVFSST